MCVYEMEYLDATFWSEIQFPVVDNHSLTVAAQ
jgi:hypothetical protein